MFFKKQPPRSGIGLDQPDALRAGLVAAPGLAAGLFL